MTAIVVIMCEGEMETCVCSFKGTLRLLSLWVNLGQHLFCHAGVAQGAGLRGGVCCDATFWLSV